MKLQTYITPRKDGTINVVGDDGQKYVFTADTDGALTCDVHCESTIARLLASGDFEPVNADDFDKAIELSKVGAGQDEFDIDPDDIDGEFSEEVAPGGMPVEANTPPVARKAKQKKTD